MYFLFDITSLALFLFALADSYIRIGLVEPILSNVISVRYELSAAVEYFALNFNTKVALEYLCFYLGASMDDKTVPVDI